MSRRIYRRALCRCAECGEDQDLSYIVWEDCPLCTVCFAKAVEEYASRYPFMLADELGLDVRQAPEEDDPYGDKR